MISHGNLWAILVGNVMTRDEEEKITKVIIMISVGIHRVLKSFQCFSAHTTSVAPSVAIIPTLLPYVRCTHGMFPKLREAHDLCGCP